MSDYKTGLKNIESLDTDMRIGMVVADFNHQYTTRIEAVNREFFEKQGFQNIDTYSVPGAFELPGFSKKLIETEEYDLIIAIGVVIR
jgi:6,7-dimethyl-8-ribityllumazine synthase